MVKLNETFPQLQKRMADQLKVTVDREAALIDLNKLPQQADEMADSIRKINGDFKKRKKSLSEHDLRKNLADNIGAIIAAVAGRAYRRLPDRHACCSEGQAQKVFKLGKPQ